MKEILAVLEERYGDRLDRFLIPPPSFESMRGEFLGFDRERGVLQTRFPVLREWLNPYGLMQGGLIAAAVDNTLGPLSMLIAPPNVTRRLEMKYSRGVDASQPAILVEARFISQDGRWLHFQARVHDPEGGRFASASATHWILEPGAS
jgi:acyl-coenzyme A thioesterase PaaI-like protein